MPQSVEALTRRVAQLEQKLQICEERFHSLVSDNAAAMLVVDEEGMVHYANSTAEQLLGLARGDFWGQSLGAQSVGGETCEIELVRQSTPPVVVEVHATSTIWDGQPAYTITLLDVSARKESELALWRRQQYFQTSISTLDNADGEIMGVVGVGREITELKEAEASARTIQKRLQAIVQTSPAAIFAADLEAKVLMWNPAAEQWLGWREEEVVGTRLPIIPEHQWAICHDMLAAVKEGRTLEALEIQLQRRDGSLLDVSAAIAPLVGQDGAIYGAVIVALNMSERKRAEERLHWQGAALAAAANAIVITDETGAISWVNPAFSRLTGYASEEVIGKNPRLLKSGVHDEAFYRQMWETISAGKVWHGEMVNKRKDGTLYYEEQTITPVRGWQGKITLYIAVKQDITTRKQMEDALKQERKLLAERVVERTAELVAANAELAQAARLKDEFLANMSHELRTPLSAILNLSESLKEGQPGALNEKQQAYLRTIIESGYDLLALINDILDLSKMEAGKMKIEIEPLSVESMCQASLRMVEEQARRQGVAVLFKSDPSVPVIKADSRRMKQVLVNLLSNAVKFTPEGGKIGLDVEGNPENHTMAFTVWDTGIGIASSELPRLFKPFVQLDGGLARKYAGTGLGLALVSRLVRLQGGSVQVESEEGKGSQFRVVLPWSDLPFDETHSPASVNGAQTECMLFQEPARTAPSDSVG